jgi:predicted murein hydrolase (TIGR00659 family)
MYNVLETPIFGIVLTVIAFEIGIFIAKKTKNPFLNPLVTSLLMILAFLIITKIPYDNYKIGGEMISYFLGPVTVILAVPLYKQFELLKKNALPILVGIFIGVLTSFVTIIIICKLMGTNYEIIASIIPKSITTPMGISLSQSTGGIQAITIIGIVISGNLGAMIAEPILRFLKIKSPVAKGIAIGTASHAGGTTKAVEMGEVEGAMSSLAIGVCGVMTVLIVPILYNLFL